MENSWLREVDDKIMRKTDDKSSPWKIVIDIKLIKRSQWKVVNRKK